MGVGGKLDVKFEQAFMWCGVDSCDGGLPKARAWRLRSSQSVSVQVHCGPVNEEADDNA